MTALTTLPRHNAAARAAAPAGAPCTVCPGAAISLLPRAPTALRIAEGRAWVTLDDGPHGRAAEAAGDVFLQAGQTLWVASGQHAVVEPLDGRPLRYRLGGLADAPRPSVVAQWWQRVWGERASAHAGLPGCCA